MIETKKRSVWIAIVLLAALMLLSLGPRQLVARAAQTYYVATNGNDSNPGTQDRPWRTIQKAANSVQAGDTVYVRGGTYNESVHFKRSGQSGNPITFKNYNGEGVTVRANSWVGFHLNANWVVIDGFGVFGAGSHDIFITGAHYNTVQNCEFAEAGWAGIQFGGDNGAATNNMIRNNNVHNNRHEGIYLRGGLEGHPGIRMSNNVIENNDIHHNGDEGIQNTATFAPPYPDGTIIRGNRVHDNGGNWGGGMAIGGDNLVVENNIVYNNRGEIGGIWLADSNNGIIRNNLVVNNRGTWSYGNAGIHVHNSRNAQVHHNTVSGNNGAGIYLRDTQGVAKNNILSQNGNQLRLSGGASADRNLIDGGSDTQGANPVQGNPQFVNPGGGDWHLASSSPAIDKGADVGVRNDMEGGLRPQGNGFDLGALEYGAESPNTEPTAEPTAVPTATPVPTLPPGTFIIDDTDDRFATTHKQDAWVEFAGAEGEHYGGSHVYNREIGTGEDMARWTFTVPEAGIYNVYAWWWAAEGRPVDVPYTINSLSGSSVVRMNQQTGGGKWNYLGNYSFQGEGSVTVSDNASSGADIVADAIKVQRVGPIPTGGDNISVLPLVMNGGNPTF